jgi:hypothetical protein
MMGNAVPEASAQTKNATRREVMSRKSILLLGLVVVLCLVSVGVWAQTRRDPTAVTRMPVVLSGENIGVRLGLPDKSGKVTGTLVVKINGQWVDVVASPTLVPTDIK